MGGGCGGGGRKVCRKRALDFCGGWGTRNSLTNCHICKKEGVCVCVCASCRTHTRCGSSILLIYAGLGVDACVFVGIETENGFHQKVSQEARFCSPCGMEAPPLLLKAPREMVPLLLLQHHVSRGAQFDAAAATSAATAASAAAPPPQWDAQHSPLPLPPPHPRAENATRPLPLPPRSKIRRK